MADSEETKIVDEWCCGWFLPSKLKWVVKALEQMEELFEFKREKIAIIPLNFRFVSLFYFRPSSQHFEFLSFLSFVLSVVLLCVHCNVPSIALPLRDSKCVCVLSHASPRISHCSSFPSKIPFFQYVFYWLPRGREFLSLLKTFSDTILFVYCTTFPLNYYTVLFEVVYFVSAYEFASVSLTFLSFLLSRVTF